MTAMTQEEYDRIREAQMQGVHIVADFNPFRRFCTARGITGKAKKKFRKVLAQRASAKAALEREKKEARTQGGLVNVGQSAGHYRTPGR